jgi:hypothetical protein
MGIKLNIEHFDKDTKKSKGFGPVRTRYNPDTGEAIQSDAIEIESAIWTRESGTLYVEFTLGGTDANGAYVRDLGFPVARYVFYRDKHTQALWEKYNLSDGPPSMETLYNLILEEIPAIHTVARIKWRLPSIQAALNTTKPKNNK